MRRSSYIILMLLSVVLLQAQTLNIEVGSVHYLFPSAQAGEMTYKDGKTLTVMGKELSLSNISKMYADATTVTNSSVSVAYSGTSAVVTVAGNIAQYLDITVSGAHVRIDQSEDVSAEISYVLSGTSTDGSFYTSGSSKISFEMNSLNLTCNDSAAVNIHNGKRIALKITGSNSLADGKSGSQKACLLIKGHPEVSGSGSLTLTGNSKHALKTNEYMQLKTDFTGSIIVKSAVADGMHIGQYLELNSGTLTVLSCGDDGIQVEKTDDKTDELNGQVIIKGGTVNATITADAGKGLKSDSLMTISGGVFNITTSGGGVTGTNDTTSACACIKAGGNLVVSGGTFTLKSTGSGGKGISVDGTADFSGCTMSITTTGTRYSASGSNGGGGWFSPRKGPGGPGGGGGPGGWGDDSTSSYKRSSPKGIKADGNLTISGGTFTVSTTGAADGSEGIESKKIITISGGTVTVKAYDDAINSASHMYIKGGTVSAIATNNDGLDSNGNLYIQGGTVMAFGGSSPECGLDAKEGCYLYITGGNVLAVGCGNNSVSSTTGSQGLVSTSGKVTAGTTVRLTENGSTTALATFTIPSDYTTPSGSGGGWGGGGSSSMSILVSANGMKSGTKYDLYNNSSTATTLTASNTYSGR